MKVEELSDKLTKAQIAVNCGQPKYVKSIATAASQVPISQAQQRTRNYESLIAKQKENGLGTQTDPNTKIAIELLRDCGDPRRTVY